MINVATDIMTERSRPHDSVSSMTYYQLTGVWCGSWCGSTVKKK